MNILQRFRKLLTDKLGKGSYTYGILKPCRRCVYGKSTEPILIFSLRRDRGVRCIVNYNKNTYTRRGKCLGFNNCCKCLEKIDNPNLDLPCNWIKI